MTIRYISTRGDAPPLAFSDAVLAGLAPDGGLYVPGHIPAFSVADIAAMKALSYPELAFTIISRFADDIAPEALKKIINESYKEFRHPEIAPLKKLDDHTYILELFHGPTLAFKDFALQFLGRLLEHINREHITIIGATSGDTGSAAIAGCRGRKNMDIFILHPNGAVSEVQRRQMTTVLDDNVHNIAINGTFDDCQNIVKALFNDKSFREKHHLTAVNSINWARIVAQIPYYFYAALKLGAPDKKVGFSVPTGNFGDIYAGYIAKKMVLPVEQLIIATNKNDILTNCVKTGVYQMRGYPFATHSPSMDIQVSSNFERLLFDLYNHDGKAITNLMSELRAKKSFRLTPQGHVCLQKEFASASVTDETTIKTIAETYKAYNYLLDPHTAVGLAAGQECAKGSMPLVVLATAHPAKFSNAIHLALSMYPELPDHLKGIFDLKERYELLPADAAAVKNYIATHQ